MIGAATSGRARAVLGFGALVLMLAMVPSGSASETLRGARSGDAQVETQVRAFLEHYLRVLESGDEDAIASLFVADERFSWFTDGAKSYASPEDVLAGMRKYAGIRFATTLSNVEVLPLSGPYASAHSEFQTVLSLPGADEHEYGGVITWLLEREPASGAWRVLQGHTSTPGGPPREDSAPSSSEDAYGR